MRRTALLCGLLALATAALYARSVGFDFVSYDDGEYVQLGNGARRKWHFRRSDLKKVTMTFSKNLLESNES